MLDGVEANRAELTGLLHSPMLLGKLKAFQQAQNLPVFPPAMFCPASFHQAAQGGAHLVQAPAM